MYIYIWTICIYIYIYIYIYIWLYIYIYIVIYIERELYIYILFIYMWTGCVVDKWILSICNKLTSKSFSVISGNSQTGHICLTPIDICKNKKISKNCWEQENYMFLDSISLAVFFIDWGCFSISWDLRSMHWSIYHWYSCCWRI